jgi:hypothetical protein
MRTTGDNMQHSGSQRVPAAHDTPGAWSQPGRLADIATAGGAQASVPQHAKQQRLSEWSSLGAPTCVITFITIKQSFGREHHMLMRTFSMSVRRCASATDVRTAWPAAGTPSTATD